MVEELCAAHMHAVANAVVKIATQFNLAHVSHACVKPRNKRRVNKAVNGQCCNVCALCVIR